MSLCGYLELALSRKLPQNATKKRKSCLVDSALELAAEGAIRTSTSTLAGVIKRTGLSNQNLPQELAALVKPKESSAANHPSGDVVFDYHDSEHR